MGKDFNQFKNFIKGKKVAVVGVGVSNKPLIEKLVDLGANVVAFDKRDRVHLEDIIVELSAKGVYFELGEKYLDKLEGFDVIFRTPGMRHDIPEFIKAIEGGAYLTSEMEEFVRYCKGNVFAITGSDGKTTTTTIVSELLNEQGYKVWTGGNIGTPLFSKIEEIEEIDMVVLELSSFQLMNMDSDVNNALVTNISPNHLDYHKGMGEYIEAKKNIFKYQNENQRLVLNLDNEYTSELKKSCVSKCSYFSVNKVNGEDGSCLIGDTLVVDGNAVCNISDLRIKGMHNVENFLAAFELVKNIVSTDTMRAVATRFGGVPHRCEFVDTVDGVHFYNDSIASSPTRAVATIKSFDKKIVLIAGGYDKNIPFEFLAEEGHKYIKELIVMGDTRNKIIDAFSKVMSEKDIYVPISEVYTMEEAILTAKSVSGLADTVVLSPACASFDMFRNFEERGNEYKRLVGELSKMYI